MLGFYKRVQELDNGVVLKYVNPYKCQVEVGGECITLVDNRVKRETLQKGLLFILNIVSVLMKLLVVLSLLFVVGTVGAMEAYDYGYSAYEISYVQVIVRSFIGLLSCSVGVFLYTRVSYLVGLINGS